MIIWKVKNKLAICLLLTLFSCFSARVSVKLNRVKPNSGNLQENTLQVGWENELINYFNSQYTGTMIIGSNNQSFNLIFDTSSPWSWVLNSASGFQGVGSKFDCIQSLTCKYAKKSTGDYMRADYFVFSKNRTVQGILASDLVSFPSSQVFNQSFLIMNEDSADLLVGIDIDGVCGLGLGNELMPPLLSYLKGVGLIKRQIFSLYLNNNPEAYGDDTSEILFGEINHKAYTGNFITVQAKNSPYWQVNLKDTYLIWGNKSSRVEKMPSYAVLDSGVNTIKMSSSAFNSLTRKLKQEFGLSCSFKSELPMNRYFACDCEDGKIDAFPNLSFFFDSQVLSIPPSLYLATKKNLCILLIDDYVNLKTESVDDQRDNNTSDSSSTLNADLDYLVLGTPFFRTYYTVFDADNKTISFAQPLKLQKDFITAMEIIYVIFGVFIFIMFGALAICTAKIWISKNQKDTRSDRGSIENVGTTDKNSLITNYKLVN